MGARSGWSPPLPRSITARATRTCRTACRRSPIPPKISPGARASTGRGRWSASSTRMGATSPRPATWWTEEGESLILAIKIDVDTYRGTREGVPRLVELLKQQRAAATFLFSLGPDHTGRAITRVFRKNFISKVRRTSVVKHYGLKTLLYPPLLPPPPTAHNTPPN